MWLKTIGICFLLFVGMRLQADVWVGYPAPDFTAKDLNGADVSLHQYLGKIVVLIYQDVDDPFTKKFYSRLYYEGKGYLQTLEKKFMSAPNNVVWLMIDMCDPPMSTEQWKEWLTQEGATPTALIRDTDRSIAKLYGVSKVPEAFVINADGMVAYKGAIDSIRSSDPTDLTRPSNRRYLEMAVQQLLDGKSVFTPDTIPYGESVKD